MTALTKQTRVVDEKLSLLEDRMAQQADMDIMFRTDAYELAAKEVAGICKMLGVAPERFPRP